jgi:hypothetical protein
VALTMREAHGLPNNTAVSSDEKLRRNMRIRTEPRSGKAEKATSISPAGKLPDSESDYRDSPRRNWIVCKRLQWGSFGIRSLKSTELLGF